MGKFFFLNVPLLNLSHAVTMSSSLVYTRKRIYCFLWRSVPPARKSFRKFPFHSTFFQTSASLSTCRSGVSHFVTHQTSVLHTFTSPKSAFCRVRLSLSLDYAEKKIKIFTWTTDGWTVREDTPVCKKQGYLEIVPPKLGSIKCNILWIRGKIWAGKTGWKKK